MILGVRLFENKHTKCTVLVGLLGLLGLLFLLLRHLHDTSNDPEKNIGAKES